MDTRRKLSYAKKAGRDWLVPNIEVKPERRFSSVQYIVEKDSEITSIKFPLLAASDSITILQDQNTQSKFICYLNNYMTKFHSKLELTRSEVVRLEHTFIESGEARVGDNIQFIPS